MVAAMAWLPDPESVFGRLTIWLLAIAVGAVEGALIGWAQGSLLKSVFPALDVGRLVRLTALVAMAGWALGMAPSLLWTPETGASAAPAVEPALVWVLLVSAVGGALGGAVIAWIQAKELRRHGRTMAPWVAATALGWAIGLPLDVLGASILDADSEPALIVLSGAGFGLLAGLAFALPTGLVARRWSETAQ